MNDFKILRIKYKQDGYLIKLKNCGPYCIYTYKKELYVKYYRPPHMSNDVFDRINSFINFINSMSLNERIEYLERLIESLKIINKYNL